MKLLIVALITICGLLANKAPEQLNNTAAITSEKPSQVAPQIENNQELKRNIKPETKRKARPKVIHKDTVTPLVTSTTPDCDAHDELLARHFGDDIRIAKAVMRAESGCRTDAVGDTTLTFVQDGVTYGMSCGLFQIRSFPGRPTCEAMKDARKNIEYAASMHAELGWQPWSAYLNGSYAQFLN